MKLAFIGLGAMGFPMARHLAKQHEVIVWNRTREKAERHAREYGSHLARDLAQCAEGEVIITMLPTSKEVDEIVDQLENHLRRGTLWIDATSALAVTNAGSGRSNASENLLPMRLVEGKWPLIFKLVHHDKDIRIATSIAHQQHASTPLLALTQNLFTAALHQLGDKADYIEVAKVIAEMNGTTWEAS